MKLSEDIEFLRIYWVRGSHPRGSYAIADPPVGGWQNAFLLDGRVALDPYTCTIYDLPPTCNELQLAERSPYWNRMSALTAMRNGWRRSTDDAAKAVMARVFEALGEQAPETVAADFVGRPKARRGKPQAEGGLLKPVKRASKRGRFLEALVDAGGSSALEDLQTKFRMTRNNALSYLHMLRKDHGIGYALGNGRVTLTIPEGELWT